MEISLAQRIFNTNKSFVLFHTHSATREAIEHAIMNGKSMDLDICIDDSGSPYLGHSKEYYEKSGETQPETMAFWEAIELISKAGIPVIVDCKHYDAWPIVEKVISQIGVHRCLVHSFAAELKFDYKHNDRDYLTEWSPIKKLTKIKNKFPLATITASCKFLPNDLLLSAQYEKLLSDIRKTLKDNHIDTACLNVPDNTMSDKVLEFFLKEKILPHVGIDKIDVSKLSKIYVGETDDLASASNSKILDYQSNTEIKEFAAKEKLEIVLFASGSRRGGRKEDSGGNSARRAQPVPFGYFQTDALVEEKFVKSGKGKERIKYLLENYFKNKSKTEGCLSG